MQRLPLNNSQICFFNQTVLKLMISLKRGMQSIIWQTIIFFRIVHCGTTCSSAWTSERSYADWYSASIEPFRSFLVSHYSRRDSEMWRIHSSRHRRQRTLCHLSRGTDRGELVASRFGECLTGQNKTKKWQGRAGLCRIMTGEAAFLGFSPSDILVGRTRVSAMSISPIRQGTFSWPIFLLKNNSSSFQWSFITFFHHIFLNFFLWGF